MWKSSRREDEVTTPTTEPSTFGSPVPPAVSTPLRSGEPVRETTRSSEIATIGKSVVVKGELSGSEDLVVDGEVEGSITLRGQSLTIGPNGRVRANIEARNVILHGRVDGDIHASDRVELRKSASLSGDITTARISIEDGAFFKGTIDIQKPEPAQKIEPRPPIAAAATCSRGHHFSSRVAAGAEEVLALRRILTGVSRRTPNLPSKSPPAAFVARHNFSFVP